MRVPAIRGVIDRRVLVNFRVDAAVMRRALPEPFRPKLVHGYAIGGICLIRLKHVRPKFLPLPFGIQSENAAHRIAVQWDQDGQVAEGVYVPRRDTDSCLNTLAGGRLFPGEYHHARFDVDETSERYRIDLKSDDGGTSLFVDARVVDALPEGSVFASLDEASQFFESGAVGYSATHEAGRFDGMQLKCDHWQVSPMVTTAVRSSYFEDRDVFPQGSVTFDCALLMTGIPHEWHSRTDLCCEVEVD